MSNIEEGYSLENHIEGTSRHLDAPLLHLDLARAFEGLKQGKTWEANGHNAKTLVKYPDLRVVLIALKRGVALGSHHTIGRLTLQTLEGHVRVKVSTGDADLPQGALLALGPSITHDVEAVNESLVLLTIAWPTRAPAP